ncbi:MAG: hypothetical protein WKG00_07890 [Polyangiaceae bacterium]
MRTRIHSSISIAPTSSGSTTGRTRRVDGYITNAVPATAHSANGKRKMWVKNSATSAPSRASCRPRDGLSSARSVSPTTMANSPSAPTKLKKPQWVRLHQHSGSAASPSSGLFFIPQNIVASPAGSSASITPAASFTAVTMGTRNDSSAPTTYMDT